MREQWHEPPIEDFVGFLHEVSREQEVLDRLANVGGSGGRAVSARVLLTALALPPLVVLLWAAGRFDLWLSPVWVAATAIWWVGSVWFARTIWAPAPPTPAAEPFLATQ